MNKRLLPTVILIIYVAILIKVMVFKDIPTIRVGQLMLNFGGADASHPANFVPFKTILPYLMGYKGWIIAGINLFGNIALLVPIGFLAPLVYTKMTWKKSLVLGIATGLVIEILQTVLRVGIFDIDDVILNAFGVMVGYWIIAILLRWIRERKYVHMFLAAIIAIAIVASVFYSIYPKSQPVQPGADNGGVSQNADLCGGTGGNGEIASVGNNTITIKRKDGTSQTVILTDQITVKTSAGAASTSDLNIGDSITMVGDANPDGTFTAYAVFVCTI